MKITAAGELLLLAACGRDDQPPPPSQEEPYTVYFAGDYNDFSCYWKDGERYILSVPDGTRYSGADAIEVCNGSVCVFGSYRIGAKVPGCLWKDGNLVDLNMDPERDILEVFTLSDGKICFGGSTFVNRDNALLLDRRRAEDIRRAGGCSSHSG